MTDLNRPLLGEPNAPCRTCGAPLAADQRYCLQCGTRRAEARLPFLEILARQAPAAAVAETTTVQTRKGPIGRLGGLSTNAAAVAGVACLLLALGVGVLIGGIGDPANAGQPAPQIITIPGNAPAAAPPTTAVPGTTETTPQTGSAPSAKSSKKGSAGTGAASSSSGSKATNKALKSLGTTKGSDYSKKSQKLPKTLGTGGKAPPVDKTGTKIGDGSSVQSIG